MEKLPDYVVMNLSEQLAIKSTVIAVPISDEWFDLVRPLKAKEETPLKLVWNHRWEYDKGPDRLLSVIKELNEREVWFELNIVGEAFRQVPGEFNQIKNDFSKNIKAFGYISSGQAYKALLSQCDVALSTSIHEFQGVAVMEAVSAGCLPLVPDRLSYQELIPQKYRYASHLDSPRQEAVAAVDCLLGFFPSTDIDLRAHYKRYSWSSLTDIYRSKISELIGY
jgi:glycosyltransferase involved in cell wall biosynthesis